MKRIEGNKEETERERQREGNRNNHPIHTSVLFLLPISNFQFPISLWPLNWMVEAPNEYFVNCNQFLHLVLGYSIESV